LQEKYRKSPSNEALKKLTLGFARAEPFHRDNIKIKSIKNGGHFPWIENPEDVIAAFQQFCENLIH
jgi:pimeloyl-ACP methyl ester carboxylesterase